MNMVYTKPKGDFTAGGGRGEGRGGGEGGGGRGGGSYFQSFMSTVYTLE